MAKGKSHYDNAIYNSSNERSRLHSSIWPLLLTLTFVRTSRDRERDKLSAGDEFTSQRPQSEGPHGQTQNSKHGSRALLFVPFL